MNMPGFTAEATLKIHPDQYRMLEGYNRQSEIQGVIPQRMKLRDVHCNCNAQTDICVCDNGRVFHNVLGDL